MTKLRNAVLDAIRQDNLYGALFIALALPDICGKIENPNAGSKERYISWFNSYLRDKYINDSHPQITFLTGEDMYAFRCALLHEGTEDITTQSAQLSIDRFILISEGPHLNYFKDQTERLQISVKEFCTEICEAVEKWVFDVKDNTAFIEYEKRIIRILPKGSLVNGVQYG
jgi:hypothetical protein